MEEMLMWIDWHLHAICVIGFVPGLVVAFIAYRLIAMWMHGQRSACAGCELRYLLSRGAKLCEGRCRSVAEYLREHDSKESEA